MRAIRPHEENKKQKSTAVPVQREVRTGNVRMKGLFPTEDENTLCSIAHRPDIE